MAPSGNSAASNSSCVWGETCGDCSSPQASPPASRSPRPPRRPAVRTPGDVDHRRRRRRPPQPAAAHRRAAASDLTELPSPQLPRDRRATRHLHGGGLEQQQQRAAGRRGAGFRDDAAAMGAAEGGAQAAAGPGAWDQWCERALARSPRQELLSPAAVRTANRLMARVCLPGGVRFQPVVEGSLMWRLGVTFCMPAYVVALASTYFQRLLVALPHLAAAAAAVPGVGVPGGGGAPLWQGAPGDDDALAVAQRQLAHLEVTLASIMVTCMHVALKVTDRVHCRGLLPFMLTAVAGAGDSAPRLLCADALLLEIRVLQGLQWRLGPHFAQDPLLGDADRGPYA